MQTFKTMIRIAMPPKADNPWLDPNLLSLTPGFVEEALSDAGFVIEGTATMLDEITQLTRARRPSE